MRLVIGAVAAALGLAALALLAAWSGFYSVAASRGHFVGVEWFLAFGMRHSVAAHAVGIAVPRLDDDALIQLGAVHFDRGCADCHGAPGMPANPIAQRMLPAPPDLATAGAQWTDGELFWIVQNGIKYTGMPGWPALERADEVWAVVAFLRVLPRLDRDRYRARARDNMPGIARIAEPCAACHGAGERSPRSTLVPSLHAQPAKFLAAALQDFAAGRRRSGIMQPVAAALTPEDIDAVAQYYALLPPPMRAEPAAGAGNAAHGRQLALEGLPERSIPPCLACHGEQALPDYPRLAGLHARYIAARLQRWQQEQPVNTPGEAVMAPLARRLNARQIDDVAAYFHSLDVAGARSRR